MGKKSSHRHNQLSSVRTAISKDSKHDNKKEMQSLISVLRPKVYITDASSFKNLVQELTGNGNLIPPGQENIPCQTTISDQDSAVPRNMTEQTYSPSDISSDWCNEGKLFTADFQSQINYYMDHNMVQEGTTSSDQVTEDLTYRDLESWLLLDVETDHNLCASAYNVDQFEGGFSSFDYELAGVQQGACHY